MREETWRLRAQDTVAAVRLAKQAAGRDGWSRDRLAAHQRDALRALVAHAVSRSPFYRERFAEHCVGPDTPLEQLPVLDKATMVAQLDRIVTDRRLRDAELRAFLEREHGPVLYADAFRVLRTGGSSRVPGVFVYDRADWSAAVGNLLRWFDLAGIAPRLPRRRVATLLAPGAQHMASRMSATIDIGLNRTLRLPVTAPVDELVAALNRHRPDVLGGYPSMLARLAAEQLDGRLDIAPAKVLTSSEPRTPAMTERIREAWGVEPYDGYATTESGGPLAADCEHHRGLHVFEDAAIVEVVDDRHRPVPDGTPGSRILVTNLHARVQPIIRMEVTDVVRVLPEPCACGRPHRLIAPVQGRTDDVLELPSVRGGTVTVHPMAFAPLGSVPGVREFEVVQRPDGLHVRVVAPGGNGAPGGVLAALRGALEPLGVAPEPQPRVEVVPAIARDASRAGKHKLVRAEL
ncbi:MAG TPA: AMP-binding protein [Baekduia sp.]|nr:AMP-binding protein [Baekduia sp.]